MRLLTIRKSLHRYSLAQKRCNIFLAPRPAVTPCHDVPPKTTSDILRNSLSPCRRKAESFDVYTYPLRAPWKAISIGRVLAHEDADHGGYALTWKKNRTTKTWSAPMQMIRPLWIKLKLTIRPSVLRTVSKFRFSRVRKYFWFREIVEIWLEIL